MKADATDLNEIVEESLLQLAPQGQDGIRITCHLSPVKMTIQDGQRQIQEAVGLLIQRALRAVEQAGPEGGEKGRVVLISGPQPWSKGTVFLEIADDGPELANGLLRDLRRPFARRNGTAAGHAFLHARDIIETYGGRFYVETPRADLGLGTRIRIRLPALVCQGSL